MKFSFKNLFLAILVSLVSGCTTTPANDKALSDPKYSVSIEDALASVGTGLGLMVKNKGETNFGLAVTEVEVKFNLAIKANDINKVQASGEIGGTAKKANANSSSQTATANSADKTTSADKQATTGENSSKEASKTQESSNTNQSNTSNTTSTSQNTEATGKATLVVEKSSGIDSDRSNNIFVRFVGLPVLVEKLTIEKLNFLKSLGYFSSQPRLFDHKGNTFGLFNNKLNEEDRKKIEEIFKDVNIKKD